MFGPLDDDTWDMYMEAGTKYGRGMMWSLFPDEDDEGIEAIQAKHRPMMLEVAKRLKGKYFVTYTDMSVYVTKYLPFSLLATSSIIGRCLAWIASMPSSSSSGKRLHIMPRPYFVPASMYMSQVSSSKGPNM